MPVNRSLGLAAAALIATAAAASAQSWPTFELDLGASSVDVRSTGCAFSCTGFDGRFGTGAQGFSWTPDAADASYVANDFFVWETASPRRGTESYRVEVELVFSSPDVQTAATRGRGLVANLWGDYSSGVLRWSETARVVFDQGSALDIAFGGISGVWNGSVSTAATFVGNLIEPLGGGDGSTAPVPLPGSLVMLLTAFGAVGVGHAMRRRSGSASTEA
jgi:hypothetical protein